MDFNEFKLYVSEEVTRRMGDEYIFSHTYVTKNNGINLTGLNVHRKGNTISPTFYLENFYEFYEHGTSVEKIITILVDGYTRYEVNEDVDFGYIGDYQQVKPKVLCKLINYSKNAELLENAPYIKVMDLAVVFFVLVSHEKMGNGSILIKNDVFSAWGISLETLYNDALSNTRELMGFELRDIKSVLINLLVKRSDNGEDVSELIDQLEKSEEVPMYVLSNKECQYGAVCMLYEDMLLEFASKIDEDLYILPSSVHELIIVPSEGYADPVNLVSMVRQVNAEQVSPDEVLSDNVYRFDRAKGKVTEAYSA